MRKIGIILGLAFLMGLAGCAGTSTGTPAEKSTEKSAEVSTEKQAEVSTEKPVEVVTKEAEVEEEVTAEEPKGQNISTYFHTDFMSVDDTKAALESAGFEIVTEFKSKAFQKGCKKGTVLIATNAALKAEAAKPMRAQAAIVRILVDAKRKQVSFTNPVYFGKTFMQEDFNYKVFKKVQNDLKKAFPSMEPSKDHFAYDELENYHFMMGMPYYDDMVVVGNGNTEDLVKKAEKYKKGKLIVFKLKLSDNSYLIGYDLGTRTSKFIKKTGTHNAEVLPYTIMIEDGKAKILNAKYYLAVSYPQLTMGEFMTIAIVPGAIEKDLKKPFK